MDKWLIKSTSFSNVQRNSTASTIESENNSNDVPTENVEVIRTLDKKKVKKYLEAYLEHGFTYCIINDEQRPQCVVCYEVLANESMKPSKLKRHIATKHVEYQNKSIDFFKRKLVELKRQKSLSSVSVVKDSKLLRASYEVSYLIAKDKKPYTIGETLIKPAVIKICELVLDKDSASKIKLVPLSNDTVAKRINKINENLFTQLLNRIKKSVKFAIQLDESTDITNYAQLLVYVRFFFENQVNEDLLFCQPLEEKTTGEDIFKKIDDFFKVHDLKWGDCGGVCTDGAAAMTGKNKGLLALIKKRQNGKSKIIFTHCVIHREALASKKMSTNLEKVLRDAISIINFIKSRALNSRLFSKLCQNLNLEHDKLLLHTEVRWLSKGKSLRRLIELTEEVKLFLIVENPPMAKLYDDDQWLCTMAYLTDIFEKLNQLNENLQGKGCDNILIAYDKILAFIKKISIWKLKISNENIDMFPCLTDLVENKKVNFIQIKDVILNHLSTLQTNFEKYYSDDWDIAKYDWIRNPFTTSISTLEHLSLHEQEQLTELASDRTLKLMFQEKDVAEFWLSVANEYPNLSEMAMYILLPFASTYLCEAGFSALLYIKSKYRTRLLTVENDMRISLSKIAPQFDQLCSRKQQQRSH